MAKKKQVKHLEQSLADVLRKAILNSEHSRYRISQLTGIAEATVSRFVSGKTSMSLDNADKICKILGLHLTKKEDTKDE